MTTRLRFEMVALLPLIEHCKKAKEHRAPYMGKPEPALWLVKDDGIYLMSSGKPAQDRPDGTKGVRVVYARSFEPDAPDCWERARFAVGGDDFVETLPLDWFTKALEQKAPYVVILFGKKSLGIEYQTQPQQGGGRRNHQAKEPA